MTQALTVVLGLILLQLPKAVGLLEPHQVNSACLIPQCACSNPAQKNGTSVHCFVESIVYSEPTIVSLPPDVTSLKLTCNSHQRWSVLSEGIFEKFVSLKSIIMEHCQFSRVNKTSFKGLSHLLSLVIKNSQLPTLSRDTLRNLKQLEFLSIVACSLQHLPDFSDLSSLRFFNISGSDITSVSDEYFMSSENGIDKQSAEFLNLTMIDISHTDINTMPLNFLERAPFIEELYMKRTQIRELLLPSGVVFHTMRVLDASETALDSVNISSLTSTSALQVLLLDGNATSQNWDVLQEFPNLQELRLNNFRINDTIWTRLNSSSLLKLELRDNGLKSIRLDEMRSLLAVKLDRNKISFLDNTTFSNQKFLQGVTLSSNNIEILPEKLFQMNKQLVVIVLSFNQIQEIGQHVFRGLNGLVYLDLSYNRIQRLPYSIFQGLTSLFMLHLEGNDIKFLPSFSDLKSLNSLNISSNQLFSLTTRTFRGLNSLQFLYVNDNKLTNLPQYMLLGCRQLLQADFQNNQIVHVGSFGDHPRLMTINLDNNSVTDFVSESPFIRMKNLQYIFLDDNHFTAIQPRTFPSSIKTISLSKNDLGLIYEESFKNVPNLAILNIRFSRKVLSFSSSSVSKFRNHDPKPHFLIGFSVLLCSCDMAFLKVWADHRFQIPGLSLYYPEFSDFNNVYCYTPTFPTTETSFNSVALDQFSCSYNETFCDYSCSCCQSQDPCPCALTCPEMCNCYIAGSAYVEIYFYIYCDHRKLSSFPKNVPSRATRVYLEGNNIEHVAKDQMDLLKDTEVLCLNDNKITAIENGCFSNITALTVLRLDDNLLASISEFMFGSMTSLKELYLHNNVIQYLSPEAFLQLSSLHTLTLHSNRLTSFASISTLPPIDVLTLTKNPWSCGCDNSTLDFISNVQQGFSGFVEREQLCCFPPRRSNSVSIFNRNQNHTLHNDTLEDGLAGHDRERTSDNCYLLLNFDSRKMCATPQSSKKSSASGASVPAVVVALSATSISLTMMAAVACVIFGKRSELLAWVYVKFGVRLSSAKGQLGKMDEEGDRPFDVFISFSSHDDELVRTELVPGLEGLTGRPKYRVCVHYRDFPVGGHISHTICCAIENSRRTILLLSHNFLASEWCRFEFQTAHMHILREGSHRLIIVLLDKIKEELLDPDLKVHLKTKTYLKYNDPWFWEKLYYALPDIRDRQKETDEKTRRDDIIRGMRILANSSARHTKWEGDDLQGETSTDDLDLQRIDNSREMTRAPVEEKHRHAPEGDGHSNGLTAPHDVLEDTDSKNEIQKSKIEESNVILHLCERDSPDYVGEFITI